MDEDIINETEDKIVFDTIERKQDYGKILFNMSRYNPNNASDNETPFITICERAWCADVSQYIIELENKIHSLMGTTHE